MNKKIIPIVLAGGVGSRLWPLSQEIHPKQFIKLFNNQSLFQKTLIRNKKLGKITVVTTEVYKNLALEQSIEVGLEVDLIIEPIMKNTAASCLVAAFYHVDPNSFLLFLPSDHYINGENEYEILLDQAISLLDEYKFISIGIKPKNANVNYGYIKTSTEIIDNIYLVESFKEKPSQEYANEYINSTYYFWNSGIYLINSKYLLEQAYIKQKMLYINCYDAYQLGVKLENNFYLARKPYEKLIAISFDYALVEYIKNMILITANFVWHDLGSWDSMCKLLISENNNYSAGDVIFKTLINTYLNSLKKSKTELKLQEINYTANEPEIFLRQWGYYQVLVNTGLYKIKELTIHPGRGLSLQYHLHRIEFWVVIKGVGEIFIGYNSNLEKKIIKDSDFITIPIKMIHKLINIGDDDLRLIEVQTGEILEENDIVRLEENAGIKSYEQVI